MSGTGNTTKSVASTGNQFIDGVLTYDAWADSTLYYSFSTSSAAYSYTGTGNEDLPANFNAITAAQQTAAHFALSADDGPSASAGFSLEGFTAINVASLGSTNSSTAEIRFGETSSSSLGTAQVADFPGNYITGPSGDNGDVWFGSYSGYIYRTPVAGNYAWHTHLHEIGHALGLKHGQENSGAGPTPAAYDSMEYSVMTYRSYVNDPLIGGYSNETYGYAQSYMMADIAALQHMYGADFTTNSGDTVYKWNPNSGDTLVNGAVAIDAGGNRIFATVWDGGGTDTYDLSSYTTALMLDLRPGEHSVFSAVQLAYLGDGNYSRGNIFNALQYQSDTRSLIENAIGGSGDDTITGNAANNTLQGGNGADMLYGGLGNDTLEGGAGADLLDGQGGWDMASYAGSSAAVTVNLGDGLTETGGDAEGDQLLRIEHLEGSVFHDTLIGNAGINYLYGGNGNDTLEGGAGADLLDGQGGWDRASYAGSSAAVTVNLGDGLTETGGDAEGDLLLRIEHLEGSAFDDTLIGSAGINYLYGGDGNDTLEGGAGADRLDGQGGWDRASYTGSSAAVTVNLGDGLVESGGDAEGDQLLRIEHLEGSAFHDTLIGSAGINYLYGGDGNDTLEGGAGADRLDGQGGWDMASYAGSSAAVSVNLGDGLVESGGDAEGDRLLRIEHLEGSAFSDTLIGSAGINYLFGGDGNDTLEGGAGADRLDGQGGWDKVSYAGSSAGVSVNLGDGLVESGGDAEGDQLLRIEHLEGSSYADILTGSAGINWMGGGAGADELAGGGGNDRLSGGTGADDFIFNTGDGSDTITDFELGLDDIRILSGASSFGDLTITDSGANALVQFADVSITLLNVDHTLLMSDDFLFA
ncbi:M10 family metallopeptidase [Breoghania sp. L-A4]|uniref:M10 family metallopeptidase n=1 Tax=Breoghania sp. L-A4 TaxID=2304600 RepID=UPI000E360C45|nr:M10 family metallopeptidase [Breoghania sp. L-A4]AXS41375.1 hypothetical protein D1F64_16840 [Breoghania sp. L-A4]